MTEQVIRKSDSEHLNISSPIIHLPESEQLRSSLKRSQVVMVTSSSKVKASSKKSEPTSDTVIIHSGNFNLCRPGRSEEVINGLQRMYIEKQEREAAQRKESAKLFLDFIRKRKTNTDKQVKIDNKPEQDEKVTENSDPHVKVRKTDKVGIWWYKLKGSSVLHNNIYTTSWESLFMPYANNKGADQPAHLVVHGLDSIIPLLAR